MYIYRDGVAIELTSDELNKAYDEVEKKRIRYQVEYSIKEKRFSFKNYESFECGSLYESEDDAREDFIEYCIEQFLDTYECVPNYWTRKVAECVSECADYFGLGVA